MESATATQYTSNTGSGNTSIVAPNEREILVIITMGTGLIAARQHF
jgi:hypothetical protein